MERKSSIEDCQAFCKTDSRCVGWDFNTKDRKCAIKFQRTGRIKADGLVSGERDACVPGKVQSFTLYGIIFLAGNQIYDL